MMGQRSRIRREKGAKPGGVVRREGIRKKDSTGNEPSGMQEGETNPQGKREGRPKPVENGDEERGPGWKEMSLLPHINLPPSPEDCQTESHSQQDDAEPE